MRFFADENIPPLVVERLRDEGHDVASATESSAGAADRQLLALARGAAMVLITEDKDFGELQFRDGLASSGVILLRFPWLSPAAKAEAVLAVIGDHGEELSDAFTVISPERVRIRRR